MHLLLLHGVGCGEYAKGWALCDVFLLVVAEGQTLGYAVYRAALSMDTYT